MINKAKKFNFLKKITIANNSLELVYKIIFLCLNNININFSIQKFI